MFNSSLRPETCASAQLCEDIMPNAHLIAAADLSAPRNSAPPYLRPALYSIPSARSHARDIGNTDSRAGKIEIGLFQRQRHVGWREPERRVRTLEGAIDCGGVSLPGGWAPT